VEALVLEVAESPPTPEAANTVGHRLLENAVEKSPASFSEENGPKRG